MDSTETGGQPGAQGEFKPGDTIVPSTAPADQPSPVTVSPPVTSPQPEPITSDAVSQVQLPQVAVLPSQPESPFALPDSQDSTAVSDDSTITWTASEFIAHHKSLGWYGALAGGAIVLAAAVYLFTRDKISTAVVIVAGIALGGYAARQPQQQQYALDEHGLTIGQKYLPYGQFRSFSIVDEGAVSSISFFPLKRFGQLTIVYYDPTDEPAIVELLADRLPMEDRTHDMLDRFMKRIHF